MSLSYFQPLFATVIFLLIAEVLWCWKRSRRRPTFMLATMVALFLISWPPMACLVVGVLEHPYPVLTSPPPGAEAIVVLSSTVYPPSPPSHLKAGSG